MDAITIGWKKQTPGRVEIGPRQKQTQKPIFRQTALRRQHRPQQPVDIFRTEPAVPNKVKFEEHPYALFAKPTFSSKSSTGSVSQIEMYNDRQLCSVRAAIATFIIAMLIIVAAGVSVGIVFATINTSGSSGSGSGSGNKNSYTTITLGSVTSSVIIGSQTGPACSAYTQIDDPTRSIYNAATSTSCDNKAIFNATSDGSWIRFAGTGGTTIPLSSAGLNHCGGYLSGYFNDTLPTPASSIVNGTVCFDSSGIECAFSINVTAVYCPSGFYVYLLPPVMVCNARYCTN
ncbi:unnamed protein product [Rotaria magnacalcarata]|uniref:Uncharacterized protein n=2 Tax=Rotaria magnacalcarata TaxID=392030 RepID=A0A816KA57_9BILA|nr:unnamed protein product [Rotaria magnacalcarata]